MTRYPQDVTSATPTASPFSQASYQVRFDWAGSGAREIGVGADVIVWVDVLDSRLPDADIRGLIVVGSLRNRTALARWALERQGGLGDRFTIAVVAAGDTYPDGSLRFALEDLLASGSIIDALADVGIDYCSPEAAAASAAFTGLRSATGHLIGSSGSGRMLASAGRRDAIDHAIDLDVSGEVPVLRNHPPADTVE